MMWKMRQPDRASAPSDGPEGGSDGGSDGGSGSGGDPSGAGISGRATFLDAASTRFILSRLNGVDHVTIRVLATQDDNPLPGTAGGDISATAAAEVAALLREAGFDVTQEVVERMVPPPLTRFGLRYSGRQATLTVAPEVAGPA